MRNPLKAKLRKGGPVIGTWVSIGHPDVAEVLGQAGFDFLVFDTEHSPMSIETVQLLLQAMGSSRCVPIVRVAWNELAMIKRALDIGAYGVIVPWVNSRSEAEEAVRAARYPPQGERGFGPRRASLNDPDYASTANREVFLGVQIETQRALDNLDEILSVDGIDAALVGPYDLSYSLGIFRKFNHPSFTSAMKRIVSSANEHAVVPGQLAVDDAGTALRQGFRLLCMSADLSYLRDGARGTAEKMRKAIRDRG